MTNEANEVYELMKCFYGSFINSDGELIISRKGNVYFNVRDCDNKEDVICKLLEWCSRLIAKGEPYSTARRNIEWRGWLLCGYNNYLGTNFTPSDMLLIYDRLGNKVNHPLTLKFIRSDYDLSVLKESEEEE